MYEPQEKLFSLLLKNIENNNLTNKIIPFKKGVFCFNGETFMNDIDIDGGGWNVKKRYNGEQNLDCNFGGIGMGDTMEKKFQL